MFKNKTLFIVGAGASKEFGLPLGSELATNIIKRLSFFMPGQQAGAGDHFIRDAIGIVSKGNSDKQNSFFMAARRIVSGLPNQKSIDNYIYQQGDDEFITTLSKLAIARGILEGERNSKAGKIVRGSQKGTKLASLSETWIHPFIQKLFEGQTIQEVENVFNKITIISFNYDRCIQQLLRIALQDSYNLDEGASNRILSKLEILYPYGTIAPINGTSQYGVRFGEEVDPHELIRLSGNIRTFNEQIENDENLKNIHRSILNAEQMFFLGFGFHQQNMDLLRPSKLGNRPNIFATALHLSDANKSEAEARISKMFVSRPTSKEIKIRNDLGCYDLLQEYEMLF